MSRGKSTLGHFKFLILYTWDFPIPFLLCSVPALNITPCQNLLSPRWLGGRVSAAVGSNLCQLQWIDFDKFPQQYQIKSYKLLKRPLQKIPFLPFFDAHLPWSWTTLPIFKHQALHRMIFMSRFESFRECSSFDLYEISLKAYLQLIFHRTDSESLPLN